MYLIIFITSIMILLIILILELEAVVTNNVDKSLFFHIKQWINPNTKFVKSSFEIVDTDYFNKQLIKYWLNSNLKSRKELRTNYIFKQSPFTTLKGYYDLAKLKKIEIEFYPIKGRFMFNEKQCSKPQKGMIKLPPIYTGDFRLKHTIHNNKTYVYIDSSQNQYHWSLKLSYTPFNDARIYEPSIINFPKNIWWRPVFTQEYPNWEKFNQLFKLKH